MTENEDLNGAKLTHVYSEIKVAIDPPNLGAKERVHLLEPKAGHIQIAYLGM